MSNNLIRKGLALGTAIALSVVGLSAAPASADTAGLVTLSPAAGTTFNSIKGSGIDLLSTVDSDLTEATLSYLVSNPSGSNLTITSYADSSFSPSTNDTNADSVDAFELVNGVLSTTDLSTAASGTVTTNKKTFVVRYSADASDNGTLDAERRETISIDSNKKTTDVSFTVTAWLDKDQDGIIDPIETPWASKAETVNLFDELNVVATAQLVTDTLQVGSASAVANISLNKDVNPSQITDKTYGIALFKGGVSQNLNAHDNANGATSVDTADSIAAEIVYATYDSTNKVISATVDPATSQDANDTFNAGNYQVRVALTSAGEASTAEEDWTWAGPSSATVTLAVGGDSNVSGIYGYISDAKNAIFAEDDTLATDPTLDGNTNANANTVTLRAGHKVATFVAQALQDDASATNAAADTNDSYDALESATVRVKAIVTAKVLADGSKITVAGSSTVLSAAGKSVVVIGSTDAKGKFALDVTNSGAANADAYTVEFFYLDTAGAWETFETYANEEVKYGSSASYVTYAAATLAAEDGFTTPLSNVSGDTVSVTFNVADQFGQALSADANGAFGVYLVDSQSSTTFKATAAVTAGKAVFSFKNYVAKGGNATLNATLFNGTVYASDAAVSNGTASVSLFNNEATGSITATSSISNEVTYEDFIVGNVTTNTDLTELAYAGAERAMITGRVADVNGAAQAGAVVTVSGAGLQFRNGDDFATDKITFNAASDGTYTVYVWSHVANSTGVKITSTADGKTATTTLKTYLPSSVDVADNLAFSVKLPAFMVKNTTYTVTAKLTDKWNNPIKTATNGSTYGVTFLGTGSVTVNGKDTDVNKNFDKNGSVTVYVRSVKDVAGPGSLTATLGAASYTATSGATADVLPIAQQTTDDKNTKWDETVFVNEVSTDVELLEKTPTASITKAATSSVVVKNANGTTLKVVRGTVSKTVVADANSEKITLKGGKGAVKVYVNGKLIATK